MEERRTAAVVLGIIALVAIYFTAVRPWLANHGDQTVSFKSCTVHFEYGGPAAAPDIYRSAQNKLALCLCSLYRQKPDTAVANQVRRIYQEFDSNNNPDSLRKYMPIDSIIKYKRSVLDTLILID